MKSALNLPRLQLTNIESKVCLEKVFDLIREAKNVIVFFRNELTQEFRMLYSGFGEEEFLMICAKRSEDKLQDFLEKKSKQKSKRK